MTVINIPQINQKVKSADDVLPNWQMARFAQSVALTNAKPGKAVPVGTALAPPISFQIVPGLAR